MTIGERILMFMERQGITQKEFSEKAGIGQSTISDWKTKKTNPSSDKIMLISEILGVSAEELLSGKDTVHRKGRDSEVYVIDKDSEIGRIVTNYGELDSAGRERLLGYLNALTELNSSR